MEITRLIERCKQGDAVAAGELYKAYAARMKGVCRRYIGDEQTVDDLVHDAFVIIFTSLDRLRDARKAEPWMMSITRNVASKYKDHLNGLPVVPLKEVSETALPLADDNIQDVRGIPIDEVMRMVDRLPEGYANVFRLSVFEGMTHREIGAALGIAPHSSSSQLTRAKRMLLNMMQRYGVVLLLLIIPVTFFLLRKGDDVVNDEKPIIAKQKDTSNQEELAHAVDSVAPVDTLTNIIVKQDLANTMQTIPTNPKTTRHIIADHTPDTPVTAPIKREPSRSFEMAEHEEARPKVTAPIKREPSRSFEMAEHEEAQPKVKKQTKNDWQLALAYTGTPSSDMTLTDNYMTMPSYSDATTRSTKLYSWGDYVDYVNENAPMMDSVSASNMSRVAIINSGHPSEPLTETKHHERPLTLQLSFSRQLNSRWSLSTGLSYTRMKSTFQGGNENTLIYRTQKLHYVGIPLRLNYRLMDGKRWGLYTSGGLQLDLPVSGSLSTQYIFGGSFTDLNPSPAIQTTINAPWQWSFGIGAGLQYEIVPHLKVYLEPNLNYYVPSSDAVETYRTEHSLDLSLPLGIRISW